MLRRFLVVVVAACGGAQVAGTPKAVDLTKYLPSTLEAGDKPAKSGDPRLIHVRVWADASVRLAPRWKEDITDQLDYAGQILQPMLGARVQIDAWKDWDRTGDLAGSLDALAAADDGKDAAWVIGYTAPLDTASKAMADLGDAHVLGHHIVIHGYADKPETDRLAAEIPGELKDTERTEVTSQHKRHKQTVVFLHELAITLGAVAETDKGWIQNPSYSAKQITFSDRNRELMQLALDDRLGMGTDQGTAAKQLEYLDKTQWGGWIAADKELVAAALKQVVDAAKPGKTATDVPAAAYAEFDRIKDLRKVKDYVAALNELDNMLKAYPGNATLHELKCEILIEKSGVSAEETRVACDRVSELAPGDPTPYLVRAEALVGKKDFAGARTQLVEAEAKIANLAQGQADAWRKVIGMYAGIGALTWTEDAIAKAKLDKDPFSAEIAKARARYGVPRGAKFVTPEQEGELVATVTTAIGLGENGKRGDAETLLATADKKWPNAPGLITARCDMAVRANQLDAARGFCNRALSVFPDESFALYLSAIIAFKDTSSNGTKQGIDKLKHAITVDPGLTQAWHTLAKAYARDKDKTALDELGKDYQAKFGQPLPP